jgi:plastocyanin
MRAAVIVLAVTALLLGACGSESESPEELCPTPTEATSVEMADFSYDPACVSVDADASLEIRNVGQAAHTFTVEGTEIDENVDAGAATTVDLGGVAPGTYEVICTLHPQMTGALQVR